MIYCENCDFVEAHSKKAETWRWLCRAQPKRPRGAISEKVLDSDPPFERCVDVNKYNNCRDFVLPRQPEARDADQET